MSQRILKVTEVLPPAMVTLAGSSTEGSLDLIAMSSPSAGAGPLMVIVPWVIVGVTTAKGTGATGTAGGGVTAAGGGVVGGAIGGAVPADGAVGAGVLVAGTGLAS